LLVIYMSTNDYSWTHIHCLQKEVVNSTIGSGILETTNERLVSAVNLQTLLF
jgi:hypothetical protein